MSRKRGKLSREEEQFIRDNINKLSFDDIATNLNRTPETIEKYVIRKNLKHFNLPPETNEVQHLKEKLESRQYWKEVKKQLMGEEIDYFQDVWLQTMLQLRDNVLFTEELQLKQYITLEIMANRSMMDRLDAMKQVEKYERKLNKLYKEAEPYGDDVLPPEMALSISELETELATVKNSIGVYTTEYSKILERASKIQEAMKTSRAARIQKVDDSKKNWSSLIAALDDPAYREELGNRAAIMDMAREKEIERLSEYHEYGDGEIDQPMLTVETAKEDHHYND